MRGEPGVELRGIPLEARDPLGRFRRQRRLGRERIGRERIGGAMTLDERARGGFEFRRLAFEVRPRPAPPLGRVARELHAVDREHLAADEALRVADRNDRREHAGDVLAERAHEVRDRREVGRRVAA